MEFTSNAGDLARILSAIKGSIPARSTIPILQFALLETERDRVIVRGSCLEMEASASDRVEVIRDGIIAVHADTLLGIVKKLPKAATATVKAVSDGNEVEVTSGRSRYRISTLDHADFPAMQEDEGGVSFEIDGKAFKDLLTTAAVTINPSDDRPYCQGVFIHPSESSLVAVGLDGLRMTRVTCALPAGASPMPAVIVPQPAVKEIAAICDATDGNVAVTVSERRINVKGATSEITSRLVDGQFPDYERVIPRPSEHRATVAASDLRIAVDRAATVYTSLTEKHSNAVSIKPNGEGLVISAGPKGQDLAQEVIDAAIAPGAEPITVNGAFLNDAMAIYGSAKVEIQMGTEQPILITSPDAQHIRSVIMPCRR